MDFRQRVERAAVVGLFAERLFDELQRARYARLCFGVATLLLVQPREVVEIAADVGRIARALADAEGPLAWGLGLLEAALNLVDLRQGAEIAGEIWVVGRQYALVDGKRLVHISFGFGEVALGLVEAGEYADRGRIWRRTLAEPFFD